MRVSAPLENYVRSEKRTFSTASVISCIRVAVPRSPLFLRKLPRKPLTGVSATDAFRLTIFVVPERTDLIATAPAQREFFKRD
jgi:hypothetical protein